jgi:glyoxylase-like metal-dependent hydrolase (beta-lactamase superfamily II)
MAGRTRHPEENAAMDIEIVTLVVSPFQQNCRIVKDRATGEAVVIDPGDEAPRILRAIEEHDARVVRIMNTHAHLDHAGGVAPLKRALGVPFALHAGDNHILEGLEMSAQMYGLSGIEVPEVDEDLEGVESVPFGSGEIRVLHTPGHTPGGVVFLFGNEGVFGDTLFRLSVGRTDLGGDARVYARTLEHVVLALPDDTIVHTGHGPSTTIGAERIENPFLNGQIRIDGGVF